MDNQATKKHLNFIIQFSYYGIIAALALLFCHYLLPYLSPFIVGWLIAYLFRKPTQWIMEKTKLSRGLVSAVVLLLFYIVIFVLTVWIGGELTGVIARFAGEIPQFYRTSIEPAFYQFYDVITDFVKQLDPDVVDQLSTVLRSMISRIGELVTSLSAAVVRWLSGYVTKVPMMILRTFLTIVSSIVIANDYRRINTFIIRQFTEDQKNLIFEIENYLVNTVLNVLKSYGIIMVITAAELTLGFTIIGIKNAFPIACATAVMDILPVLGSGLVLNPWAVISIVTGNVWLGIKLFILYVVITAIRQVIEPRIVGTELGLHPIVSLIAMFVGTQLFGVAGLFLAPIMLSLIVYLNNRGIIKLFK